MPIGSKVLIQNQKRRDRKGGKFSYKWLRPYTLKSISKSGLRALVKKKGILLKRKYNASLLKPFYSNREPQDPFNQDDEEKGTTSHQPKSQQQTAGKNYFDKLPDEILEMILMNATALDTFASIINTCKRFKNLIRREKGGYSSDGTYQISRKYVQKYTQTIKQN